MSSDLVRQVEQIRGTIVNLGLAIRDPRSTSGQRRRATNALVTNATPLCDAMVAHLHECGAVAHQEMVP
jgi:hypothetical protein